MSDIEKSISFIESVRRAPPSFTYVPKSVDVHPGQNVTLTCAATGSPVPYVRWKLGDLELTPEGSIPVGENALTVHTGSQSATYTCVAESELGVIQKDVEIRVENGQV